MSNYTTKNKVGILNDVERIGNVSKVAEKHGVSRQSIYKWQEKEEELRKELAKDTQLTQKKMEGLVEQDVLQGIEKYADLLNKTGNLEQRKSKLGSKVEYLEASIIHLIENNDELQEMSPDRQSKVLKTIHEIRQDLYDEPDLVVEYRNNWMELVLRVLQDFLDNSEIRQFADKMQEVEQDEYEIIE